MSHVLEARGISKTFPGVKALDGVSFAVRPGSVHAVVGENGAGKSTLMKILSGVYRPDAGELLLDGKATKFDSTREAEQSGVAIIHQELNLIPALSVAENIFLGREWSRFGFVNRRRLERESQTILRRLGHDLDLRAPVAALKISDQQVVEIAKTLSLNARVIIMDEPTTALASDDVERLFGIVRTLTREGSAAVIYISHKMDELFRIADEFTVLRDGRLIGHRPASETTPNELVRMMVGRELIDAVGGGDRAAGGGGDRAAGGEELLRVENLGTREFRADGRKVLRDVNFDLRAGEILGVAGLMGAGRTELLESLFGVRPTADETRVTMRGRALKLGDSRRAIKAGIAFVTEDRKAQGLALEMSVGENITLAGLRKFTSLGFVNQSREAEAVGRSIEQLAIKTPSAETAAVNLSGGNQQKIVIAKWLLTGPKLFLLDEPTKGIDIKGKTEIYRLIRELAANGLGVIVVSSELPELLALCDRIMVLREGRHAGTLARADATEENIIELAAIDDANNSAAARPQTHAQP